MGQLITAFNETLERLEHIFTAQQRFLVGVSKHSHAGGIGKGAVALEIYSVNRLSDRVEQETYLPFTLP